MQPELSFDKVAAEYEDSRSIPYPLKLFFYNEIVSYLHSFSKSSYNILSLGIGSGRVEDILSSHFINLFGLDISYSMLTELKKKKICPPIYVTVADCLNIPFRKSFDAVIMVHLIHLIKNWHKLAEGIFNLTNTLIIGELYSDIFSHPLYQKYIRELEHKGWKKEDIGEKVKKFIEMIKREYNIEIQESLAQTKIPTKNSFVMNLIKKRVFSCFWSIDENSHKSAYYKVKDSIKDTTLLEQQTLINAYCKIFLLKKKKNNYL